MKKLLAVITTVILSSFLAFNTAFAEEDLLSSSGGWHYATNQMSIINYNTAYNSEKHPNMKLSKDEVSCSSGYAIKEISTVSSGIFEIEFSAKFSDDSEVVFVTDDRGTLGGMYYGYQYGGTVNLNHLYGLENNGGKAFCRLPRRSVGDYHNYLVRINLETDTIDVTVDGVYQGEWNLLLKERNLGRVAFKGKSFKNIKIRNYYEVDVSQNNQTVNNIYSDGEITLKSNSSLPKNACMIAGVYENGKLVGANVGNDGDNSVTVTADGGANEVRGFLWNSQTLKPFMKSAVSAKKVSGTDEKGKALLLDFEKNNPNSGFDLSNITVGEFLEQDNVSLYKRKIPDDRTNMRNDRAFADIGKVGGWYSGGTPDEKKEQLLDYTYELSGKKFSDGYQVTVAKNPLYYVLTENVSEAEKIIAEKANSGYTFTDHSHYYLYFKYGDKLSDEAKENLKTTIYRDLTNDYSQGFKWYKGEAETTNGAHHNQVYDGLVRALMFSYAFLDDADAEKAALAEEVLTRSNDILDKCVASTAAYGYAIADYNSPCYGAMIWSDLITLSDLLPESDTKAKVDLLLNRVDAEVSVLYHSETSNTVGPYARSGFKYVGGLSIRHNFPLIMYALSNGSGFYKNSESTNYSFFYPLLAAYTHRLPEYLESVAFDKTYPYNVKITKSRNSTPDDYKVDAGLQNPSEKTVYKMEETVGYMTKSYSLGSSPDTAWYIPGMRGQDTAFMARWKRSDEIKSLADTPALISYYRYNLGKEPNGTKFEPSEQGLSATAQHKNKAIVYSYPGKVTDEKLNENGVDEIYNMGTAIYITNPEDTSIYFGDEPVTAESIVSTNENEELRAKLDKLPYKKNSNGEVIYLEDKNIYAAIIPLNDCTVEIRNVNADVGEGNMSFGTYSINLCDHYSDSATRFTEEERSSVRNGYIFEIAEKDEYSSLSDFKNHIQQTSIEMQENNGIWKTVYQSGDDTLSLSFDTNNLYVTEIVANGEVQKNVFYNRIDDKGMCLYTKTAEEGYYNWNKSQVYIDNPTVFDSDNLIQSQAKEIKIGDCVLENNDGAMVYVICSGGTYVVGDLTSGENSFLLKTPNGNVQINNLDIGFMEFNKDTKQISLSKKVSDKAASAVLSE